jgi:hypothetical protein
MPLRSVLAPTLLLLALTSSARGQTPSVYQDLYSQLNRDVSDFRSDIHGKWNGSTFPVAFAGQLTDANSNNGPGLLQPSSLTLIGSEILLLKAVGVKAVSVDVSFPMLDANFFGSIGHPEYQAQFTAFYANVAAAVRAQGLELIVESQSLIPTGLQSVWGAPLQQYYASVTTFSAYQSERAATAALVAQTMRPDFFVLQEEPDTESAQSEQAQAGTVSGSTSMLSGTLAAVRGTNIPGMKIGAGLGTCFSSTSRSRTASRGSIAARRPAASRSRASRRRSTFSTSTSSPSTSRRLTALRRRARSRAPLRTSGRTR